MTFAFDHPCGVRVCRELTQSSLATYGFKQWDMHTGWVRVQLPPFQDGEVLVALSVAFNAGVLESITLTDARPEFGANWGEWSEARERLRAESIGAWLTSKGFPAGKYPWGVVGWGYDAKGGSGSAVVRYAT